MITAKSINHTSAILNGLTSIVTEIYVIHNEELIVGNESALIKLTAQFSIIQRYIFL